MLNHRALPKPVATHPVRCQNVPTSLYLFLVFLFFFQSFCKHLMTCFFIWGHEQMSTAAFVSSLACCRKSEMEQNVWIYWCHVETSVARWRCFIVCVCGFDNPISGAPTVSSRPEGSCRFAFTQILRMFTCFDSTGSGVTLSNLTEHAEIICAAAMADAICIGWYEHADTHEPKITAPCSHNLQT